MTTLTITRTRAGSHIIYAAATAAAYAKELLGVLPLIQVKEMLTASEVINVSLPHFPAYHDVVLKNCLSKYRRKLMSLSVKVRFTLSAGSRFRAIS